MGIIRRTFTYLDKTIFTRLFKSLVRPHLEYANSVWYPSLKKLKILVENVQRRATKLLPCCSGLEYEDRLKRLDLPCLAYRKLRGDIIECYKMYTGKYDSEITPPICRVNEIHDRHTRGGERNLHKVKYKKDIRKYFFRNRVVNIWNKLPTKVIDAPSIKSFEKRLDKFWKSHNIKYNIDKCIDYERSHIDPNYAGSGERNLVMSKEDDLELQTL